MENSTNQNNSQKGKSFGERMKSAPRAKWVKFIVMTILTIAFVIWTGYLGVLVIIPLFFDSNIFPGAFGRVRVIWRFVK